MDIQIIIDAEMCARYMAKYASKGEPRSQPVSSVFKWCVERLNSTSHAHTALRSAMIRSVASVPKKPLTNFSACHCSAALSILWHFQLMVAVC